MSYGGHAHLHNVAERFLWRCFFCRKLTHCGTCEPDKPRELRSTRDHLLARVHGGRGGRNLVLACKECNNRKGDQQVPHTDPSRARDPAGCYPNARSTNGRKKFGTEEAARAMCDAVLAKHGRQLEPYECPKCRDWHIRAVGPHHPRLRSGGNVRAGRTEAADSGGSPIQGSAPDLDLQPEGIQPDAQNSDPVPA